MPILPGSSPFLIARFCGSKKRVAVRALAHRRPQPLLDHREDLPIGDRRLTQLHQRSVGDQW